MRQRVTFPYDYAMADLEQFTRDLEEALTVRATEIQESVLPALKQCFFRIHSSFEALHTLLLKKGLVKNDPYSFEERISEITIPSDQPFLDSERDREMSIRTARYKSQLAFIINYYDFSLDHLDLRELKTLAQFTRYINWQNLAETATQPTTRALGEQVAKVKSSTDQLSVSIAADAQAQLGSASREALEHLKRITAYRREFYKLSVRQNLLSGVNIGGSAAQPDGAVKKIRSLWPSRMPGQPFARDLILEILAENDPDTGESVRSVLLESLRARDTPRKTQKQTGPDLKETLLEAARALASCSRGLEEAVQKLNDNTVVLESRKLSMGEMLRAIWKRLRSREDEGHTYVVEYIDETTASPKSEEIRFEEFVAGLSRRARLYNGILSKSGSTWTKLQQTEEEELLNFVTKQIQEMTTAVRRMESLDTMFRSEVDREQRKRLRGINLEATAMREHIQRARKKNHEYISRYEEIQQLKRLGINPGE